MDGFAEMRAVLRHGTGDVLQGFGEIAQGEPWLSLPQQYTLDNLHELIGGLADCALSEETSPEGLRRKVWAAAVHGEHRSTHGFAEHLLFTEYHLLRQAVWRFLQTRFADHPRLAEAINRIDSAISLATVASLRGYHRGALEAQNQWPDAIHALVEGWPGTSPPDGAASLNAFPHPESPA